MKHKIKAFLAKKGYKVKVKKIKFLRSGPLTNVYCVPDMGIAVQVDKSDENDMTLIHL